MCNGVKKFQLQQLRKIDELMWMLKFQPQQFRKIGDLYYTVKPGIVCLEQTGFLQALDIFNQNPSYCAIT